MLHRWLEFARRWAWAMPAAALALTALNGLAARGSEQAPALLMSYGMYAAASVGVFALSVVMGGALAAMRRPQLTPRRSRPRQVAAHGLVLLASAAAVGFALTGPLERWVPDRFAYRGAIAQLCAWHGATLLVASIGWAVWRARHAGEAYPFWLWGCLHLIARAVTASALSWVGQGRQGALDVVSLLLLFGSLLPNAGPARLPRAALAVALSVHLAAAATALYLVQFSELRRAQLMAYDSGPRSVIEGLRTLFDLDGDGFARIFGGQDCDDDDPRIQPGAVEIVGNGIDDNCAGGDLASYQPNPPPTRRATAPRRNLLLITVDAMRADVTHASPGEPVPMPGLAAFSRRAATFARTYVQAPYTADSLQSLITGRYPMNMTFGDLWLGAEPDLPQLLRGAGYATQVVHSIWLRDANTHVRAETAPFFLHFEGVDRELAAINESPRGVTSAAVTDRALQHFERLMKAGKPFLLWVHYFDLHAEYVAHAGTPFAGDDPRARYLQEAWTTDAEIARLLRTVEASGFFERGLTVITGDHGELLGEKGRFSHALYMDEACEKTILMIQGAGIAPGNYDTRVRLLDVAPTVLELAAGVQLNGDGASLMPIVQGAERADRDVVARSVYARRVYERAAWIGPWKLVQDVLAGTTELYRLDRDPHESVSLVDAQRGVRDDMLMRLGEVFDRAMNDRVLRARQRLPDESHRLSRR